MNNATQDANSGAALLALLNTSARFSKPALPTVNTRAYFFKLLVAQMRNQDLPDPMNTAQVALQLTQPGSSERIGELDAALQALSNSMAPNQNQ